MTNNHADALGLRWIVFARSKETKQSQRTPVDLGQQGTPQIKDEAKLIYA
jgi:hypothetical protein